MTSLQSRVSGTCWRHAPLFFVPPVAIFGGIGAWFYWSYLKRRVIRLAEGVYFVSGGGGNSLVVKGGDEIFLVDTKFAPGSKSLQRWIHSRFGSPVTAILNTHYHYDHTQGNVLYPTAQIWAHEAVPRLMRSRDSSWWRKRERGIPTELVGAEGRELVVARTDVVVLHPGAAHTGGDLYAYLPKFDIVATGDLLFHTYYPFFDTGPGGTSVPPLIAAVRRLADDYPGATFVPGHGPLATAADLRKYADYLERLYTEGERAYEGRISMSHALRSIKLEAQGLSILPSFHENRLTWATPKTNLRCACELIEQSRATSGGKGTRSADGTWTVGRPGR